MNNLMQRNDDSRPEMDGLLHEYFQCELPHPWPTFKAPRQKPIRSLWARSASRLALAACVALLIGGYLMVGGSFTTPQASELQQVAPPSAFKEKGSKAVLPNPPEELLPMPIGDSLKKQK